MEKTAPKLLMLPPAPVIVREAAQPRLDIKFVEGMRFSDSQWPGRIDCILRPGAADIPFGKTYQVEDLPFGLRILPEATPIPPELVEDYDLVICSGDRHQEFHLAGLAGRTRAKIVFVVEYTLRTRLQIAALDRTRSFPRRLWSGLWNIYQEIRRRRAFRKADGLQVNGYPAHEAYGGLNGNTVFYLDNRMKPHMFATGDEMEARARHLRAGGPLRLINSGRLEPMKGAQDLIPVARALKARGVPFTLDIYGTGSLEGEIRRDIAAHGLDGLVTLHDPVDFETELVPVSRTRADIFLSCHRQSDPSCTYLEAMGCGLAVAGFDNRMLASLIRDTRAGWVVGLGDAEALAERIGQLAASPDDVLEAMQRGLAFAMGHSFFTEFSRRNDHMMAVAGVAEA